MTTAIALLLVFAGVMSRLIPHPPNMVALGAIALFAGARLPRRWALTVPLAILAFSDLALDFSHGYQFDPASRFTTYGLFTALAFWGTFATGRQVAPLTRAGMSVTASTLFFLASNFAVWAEGTGYNFPHTFAGLMSTYAVGIPYFGNMLAADLAGTAVLFGLDALLARKPAPATSVARESTV